MAELIATGVAGATSADIVLADGAIATIGLFAAAGVSLSPDTKVIVQRKGSNAEYYTVPEAELYPAKTAVQVAGPATYRAVKLPSAVSFGVSQD